LRKFIIVPFEPELAQIWADVTTLCRRRGQRLQSGDAWIIATAVQRRLTLVTHDADQVDLNIPHLHVISYVGQIN